MIKKNFNSIRIGLDIDDVLSNFYESYSNYFNAKDNPKVLSDLIITRNVERILKKDRDFWLNLDLIQYPDFDPELFCTKRVNNKAWTKKWLLDKGLPNRPVYQLFLQSSNKADRLRGKVDVFIDDSISNMIQINLSGIPCLLMNTKYNQEWGPIGRIYTLNKEEILDTYNLFINTVFSNFRNLI